ncbi:Matrix metalloproteinase-16, partial [Stegodyphus mimosarum]
MHSGYPKQLRNDFIGIPDTLDAAVTWSGNGKPYFFKGDQYWRYDSNDDPPVSDTFPQPISNWGGLPNNLDAALLWENNVTYFFKEDKYYRFNDITSEVDNLDPPYPRPTSVWWFGC